MISKPTWVLVAVGLGGGCLPYTVATTSIPTPAGEVQVMAPLYLIPGGLKINSKTRATPFGADLDVRYGLDHRSDIGLRVPTLSGVVISYKRRLTDPSSIGGVALMPALGYVFGYGYTDLTGVASGPIGRGGEWFGGLRVMATTPLSDSLDRYGPIVGGFVGLRIRTRRFDLLPEIGIFRGPPGLAGRGSPYIVVVSLSTNRERGLGWPLRFRP